MYINCPEHGDFWQAPTVHLKGCGCPVCGSANRGAPGKPKFEKRISKAEILRRFRETHGDSYSYKKVEYEGMHVKICIICRKHGEFWQAPYAHLNGVRCPGCAAGKSHSRLGVEAFQKFARAKRWRNIQHAENGGEFRIPGTRFKVDGYHAASNTVFEFLGDRWHGNLKVFSSRTKCHPHLDLTAKQLNRTSAERLYAIKELGFNVIYIWEQDYKNGLFPSVLR